MSRDIFNFRIVEAYNKEKFQDIIDVNSNIGDELSIKNPKYDKTKNPEVPQRLYYYPIKVGLKNYLLDSTDIDKLPIKVMSTVKTTVASKGYYKIDEAFQVTIKAQKCNEYRDFIQSYLPYKHLCPKEWLVWKIICERAISETFYIRAMSFPSWGKTSSMYVWGMLRNDIEILDNSSYAKMKYSLSVKPKALVLDEVDDIDTDTKRSLSKIFRNVGGGMGKIGNDSRAVNGTTETFDLAETSIVALYNFPNDTNDKFFDTNFHPKIASRLFPLLLSGGSNDVSPLLHKHKEEKSIVSDNEKFELDKFLKNSKHYEINWEIELEESGKNKWVSKYSFDNTRHQKTYTSICNGLKLFAKNIEEFHELEDIVMQMNKNYYKFKKDYDKGIIEWGEISEKRQETLQDIERDLL